MLNFACKLTTMKYNLSEITAVIRNRRTIFPEQYSDRKVHKEMVDNVLNNALWAPTHGMTQPWRFKVFMGEARERLGHFMADRYKRNTPEEKFATTRYQKYRLRPMKSGAVIAIVMKRQERGKIPEIEEIEAVACAVQNMYLTCTAYGLGSFWSTGGGVYTEDMHAFLQLETKERCLGLFYLGYPASEWPKGQRRPLEYVTEWINE